VRRLSVCCVFSNLLFFFHSEKDLKNHFNCQVTKKKKKQVAFMEPSSDRLWLASKDPTIKVFDLNKSGQPQHTITSHSDWVAGVILSKIF
jgi:WD40 repeat protein